MFKYFIIPNNVNYVERMSDITKWEQTDKIDPNTPTVIFFTDSVSTRLPKFVVVYKNLMQSTGGSGSCYNPTRRTYNNKNPMDNSTMARHMSKWVVFDFSKLYKEATLLKFEILQQLGFDRHAEKDNANKIPYYISNCKHYADNPGLLCVILDLIALKKLPTSILEEVTRVKTLKLLTA